ncbi:MAG: hypothetical protein ACT4OO_15360 [Nitrospiraceae bacterium]
MLHRLALRVLPSLSLAVTEHDVRKRKRWVMFVPGLIAFGFYRLTKHVVPFSEPMMLLAVSGIIAMLTAAGAYRIGRDLPFSTIVKADHGRRVAWLLGWIGFVYGVQLSLLVLALLWLVGYDYLKHPHGPAMMAIIIACTAVARDAFEIGHIRRLEQAGKPVPTFPDGAALWELFYKETRPLAAWGLAGVMAGALLSVGVALYDQVSSRQVWQLLAITCGAGTMAVCAYFGGYERTGRWSKTLSETSVAELFRFWWWPGLAFASTYYLVFLGFVIFILQPTILPLWLLAAMGSLVAGLVTVYAYYLGARRDVENRAQQAVPSSLLRCPFVMGILSKTRSLPARANFNFIRNDG